MATATSSAEICNLAVDYLGQQEESLVNSIITPVTNTERLCARWYDVTRRSVLRRKPWNFAIKRVILTMDSTAPVFGFTAAFNLPNDFLRVVTLEEVGTFNTSILRDYQVESNQLLMNADTGTNLNLRYIFDIVDVTKFDAMFVDLLAVELALRLSFKLTASNTDIQRLNALADEYRAAAAAIDGQERPPIRVERSRALEIRSRLGSNEVTDISPFND